MLQEQQTVRAFPLRVGVRKVRANVAEAGRAEKRIAQSVRQNIAVRMANRSLIERHVDPAND